METKVFQGGTLFDCTGKPSVKNSAVVVKGSKIVSVGETEVPKGDDVQVIDVTGKTLMPALIDTHMHTCMDGESREFGPLPLYWNSQSHQMKAANGLKRELEMGITTIRDGGSGWNWMEVALRDGIKRGDIPGPRLFTSGYHVTVTGGHGFFMPAWLVKNGPIEEQIGIHADGPDAWRKAARLNIYNGVDAVKIVCSRDIISPGPCTDSQATLEEIQAAFHEALARGKRTIAHAEGHTAVTNAVKAGAQFIVHGFYMDDESAQLMADNGVYWEATNLYCALIKEYAQGTLPEYMLAENPGGLPDWMADKAVAVWNDKMENYKRLIDKYKVKVLMGSDAGCPYIRHGYNAMELKYMVELGLSKMDAILAGTKVAAEALGLGAELGTVEKGKLADLIVVDGDPLTDISVLYTADKIRLVMKEGEIVKTRGVAQKNEPIKFN